MPETYKAVCQWCGKQGGRAFGSPTGGTPNVQPFIAGTCPCHPSGEKNQPHSPKWEKA